MKREDVFVFVRMGAGVSLEREAKLELNLQRWVGFRTGKFRGQQFTWILEVRF